MNTPSNTDDEPHREDTGATALRMVFLLVLTGFVAVNGARVGLTLFALALGAESYAVGMLAAMFHIFPLLLSWMIGRFADRFGAVLPLLASAVSGTCGLLLPYFFPVLPAVYVAGAFSGLSFALFLVTLQNVVGLMSRAEKRAQNFGTFSMFGAVGSLVGPLIAGFSIDLAGNAHACLYVAALSATFGVILAAAGRHLPHGTRHAAAAGNARAALNQPGIVRLLATSSLVQLGTDLFQFYIPIYGHSIGLSASVIGMVIATYAIAAFIVRLVLPALLKWRNEERLLAYSFFTAAAGFLLMPFFQNAFALGAVCFVFGIGMGCGQPIITTLMFSRSAAGRSGESLGIRLTVNNVVRTSGPVMFGFFASVWGLFPVFCLSAALMAAGGMLSRNAPGKQ